MPCSDEERREVARRLREYDDEEARERLVDCADWGERVLNMLDCGDTEGECYAALADLIEPQPTIGETGDHECVPGECPLNVRHDNDFIDRDALLALADWMDRDVAETEKHFSNVISTRSVSDYACRIREACAEAGAEPPKPEDMTTCSAYDLISEEDRETLRFVKEWGGLQEVGNELAYGREVSGRVGIALYGTEDNVPIGLTPHQIEEELRKRLMPEGYEWPRYESGEPVKPGSWLQDNDGEAFEAVSFVFTCDWWGIHGYRPDRYGTIGTKYRRQLDGMAYGTHVKRPAIDALAGRVKSVPTGD